MKLWQILAVVAIGIVYGLIQPGRLAYAFGHATLYVFLPPLLFEAAWNLNFRAMRRQWIAIGVLAGPGVLLTAVIVAGALAVVRVPFGPALLTGAILSATDPIAVVAVFRRLPVPRTLATIVECESLFNDAVAVVLYRGVLVALSVGGTGTSRRRSGHDRYGGRSARRRSRSAASSPTRSRGHCRAGGGRPCRSLRRYSVRTVPILRPTISSFPESSRRSPVGSRCATSSERGSRCASLDDVSRFWDIGALLANALVFFMVGAALEIGRVVAGAGLHDRVSDRRCGGARCGGRTASAGALSSGMAGRRARRRDAWRALPRARSGDPGGISLSRSHHRCDVRRLARNFGHRQLGAGSGGAARRTASHAERIGFLSVQLDVESPLLRAFVDLHARHEIDEVEHRIREAERPGAADRCRDELLTQERGIPAQ